MASSSAVNHPEVAGHPVTSACESGGSSPAGTRHSSGMEARRAALFRAPISSQVSFFPSLAEGLEELVLFKTDGFSCWRVIFGERICRSKVSCGNE